MLQVLLADARDQEDLVVHREAEQDREHHHRHERGDRDLPVETDELAERATACEQRHDSVGGANGEQVHDRRLQGDERRAERDQQQQE
jgi:hypothetical protein